MSVAHTSRIRIEKHEGPAPYSPHRRLSRTNRLRDSWGDQTFLPG